ncbi:MULTISPECIES: DUF2294 domain-containing protein [unclassified Coleofasciculus]|uniref:DUF2294 domain-containing protein n=1 Tax=unclassified Coleofasciculus TaxID=2692782 RepID=UPI0018821A09|nr:MULTISPECIES: DUF2294 domain-containing protein [unclassified Coleofasciculus]MBE9128362.1 DUF2294 domain-containing protein [Coleofasciculus sp. LEGE 07081]MBE9151418.1 DUF2294 domain-containing protein [Coleofasciculus sp. LEGE 07092]
MTETILPTRGQLERTLSQRIQSLYREYLGHQPSKITATIDRERITILIENALTQPEQLLVERGQETLTEQVRVDLEQAIEHPLRDLIEDVVGVKVVDLLSDTTLKTGRTGTIAVLADVPKFRNYTPKSPTNKAS